MTTATAPLPLGSDTSADLGGRTLERLLADAWEDLHAQGAAACPVCGERMTSAGDRGRCGGCASELR